MKVPAARTRSLALQRLTKGANLDGYITLCPLEQRYLSGVDLSAGEAVFLITPRNSYCVTKAMLASKMGSAPWLRVHLASLGGLLEAALKLAHDKGLKRVGFDGALVTLSQGEKLLRAGCVRKDDFLVPLRKPKAADELKKIARACRIASQAFAEVRPQIKTGMTEEDVRVLLACAMIKRGAESVPFNIVCFGENTADVHHTPDKKRKLKAGEAVLTDFGCFYEGYCSDMTRSWWHGPKEPAEYTRVRKLVQRAHAAGVKVLRAGIAAGDADKAARDVIAAQGLGEYFIHTTGHAIGLYVHEAPVLRAKSREIVPENAVVTIEPGVYFAGKWGVRIEDSFLVTKTGRKKLTH